ncbi:MAG: hypothetical protein AAF270_06900 [Pseudomonadota bacterium]
MILLNGDKGLVHLESWEDLYTRPGFDEIVDDQQITLEEIIGQYRLQPPQPCGLKTCRTKHSRGFLVKVTGGRETNIGKDCGLRIFGTVFEGHERSFKRALNASKAREQIGEARSRLDSIQKQVKDLRSGPFGADAQYDLVHKFCDKLLDVSTHQSLLRRAKTGDNSVYSIRERTSAEKAEAREMGDLETIEKTLVFRISGITAVTEYRTMRKILNVVGGSELEALSKLDVDGLNDEELRKWRNWCNRLDNKLRQATKILDQCRSFSKSENTSRILRAKTLI